MMGMLHRMGISRFTFSETLYFTNSQVLIGYFEGNYCDEFRRNLSIYIILFHGRATLLKNTGHVRNTKIKRACPLLPLDTPYIAHSIE
jgi:hypothetical protein